MPHGKCNSGAVAKSQQKPIGKAIDYVFYEEDNHWWSGASREAPALGRINEVDQPYFSIQAARPGFQVLKAPDLRHPRQEPVSGPRRAN
jgi:hypothetical protein